MASNLKIVSGGLLCGNPIVVSALPAFIPDTATFHRVKMKVSATLEGTSLTTDLVMSVSADSHENIFVDISSALRSLAEQFEVERTTLKYPYIKYTLVSWDEYLENGVVEKTPEYKIEGGTAMCGKFTDIERMACGKSSKPVQFFSRKPKEGEIIAKDEPMVIPVPFPHPMSGLLKSGPICKNLSFAQKSGAQVIHYSDVYVPAEDYPYDTAPIAEDFVLQKVYVIPPSKDRYHFCFVNGFGLIETIAAECLPDETIKIESSSHVVSRPERFESFSRTVNKKISSRYTLDMSSGPLNEEWLHWWHEEFMMSPKVWIRINGMYIPCNLIMKEDAVVRKHSSKEEMNVLFSVQMDIEGGLKPIL